MFPYLALHNTLTVPYLPSLELCQLPRSPNLPYQSLSTLPLTLSSLSKSMPTLAHSLSFSLSISLNSFARLRFPSRSLSTISRSRYLYDAKLVAVATKSWWLSYVVIAAFAVVVCCLLVVLRCCCRCRCRCCSFICSSLAQVIFMMQSRWLEPPNLDDYRMSLLFVVCSLFFGVVVAVVRLFVRPLNPCQLSLAHLTFPTQSWWL